MGASNQTPTIELPLFSDDDKPTWRGDINGANNTIDAEFANVRGNIASMVSSISALNTGALSNPRGSTYDIRDLLPTLNLSGTSASGAVVAAKLNSLPPNSRVMFPAGSVFNWSDGCPITVPLTLDGYGVTIKGDAPNSTIVLTKPASGSIIRGFSFKGNSGTAYAAAHKAINFAGTPSAWVDNISVYDVSVDGYGYGGFIGYNCSNLTFVNCSVTNSVYAGFQFLSPLNVTLYNPKVNNLLGISANTFMQSYPIAFTRDQTQESITDYPNAQNCTVWGGTITRSGWEGVDTHGGINIRVFGMCIVGSLYGISAVACPNAQGVDTYPPLGGMYAFNDIEATDNQGATGAIGVRVVGADAANGKWGTGTILSNRIVGMGPGKKPSGDSADVNTTNGGILVYFTRGIHIDLNNIIEPSPFGICLYRDNSNAYIGANSIVDPWSATFTNPSAVAIRSSNNDVTIGAVRHMKGDRSGDAYDNVNGVYVGSNTGTRIKWGGGYDLSGAANPVQGGSTTFFSGTAGKLATPATLTASSTVADVVAALQSVGWAR